MNAYRLVFEIEKIMNKLREIRTTTSDYSTKVQIDELYDDLAYLYESVHVNVGNLVRETQ